VAAERLEVRRMDREEDVKAVAVETCLNASKAIKLERMVQCLWYISVDISLD